MKVTNPCKAEAGKDDERLPANIINSCRGDLNNNDWTSQQQNSFLARLQHTNANPIDKATESLSSSANARG
jgi:hypothetical protein